MKTKLLIISFLILLLAGCTQPVNNQVEEPITAGGGFMNLQEYGASFSTIAELDAILSPESVASSSAASSFSTVAEMNALLSGETVASTTASNANFVNDAGYWDNLNDMALTTGSFYIGDGSNNPIATSSLFISLDGKIGISSTTPTEELSVDGQMNINGDGTATSTIKGNILFTDGTTGCYFVHGATTTLECF